MSYDAHHPSNDYDLPLFIKYTNKNADYNGAALLKIANWQCNPEPKSKTYRIRGVEKLTEFEVQFKARGGLSRAQ